MVGRAEGAGGHEHGAAVQFAGHGMYFGGLQGLRQAERRKYGGYAFGHH